MFFIVEEIEMFLQPRTPRAFFERKALPILLSLLSYTLKQNAVFTQSSSYPYQACSTASSQPRSAGGFFYSAYTVSKQMRQKKMIKHEDSVRGCLRKIDGQQRRPLLEAQENDGHKKVRTAESQTPGQPTGPHARCCT